MNRTDRLLALVLELQRKGQQRGEDLAVTFEVSTRTIYRDMQALSEAGVPIIAIQKKGYSLAEGYFLPPLRFTTEEALILALGSDFMGHNFDDQYRAAAEAAYRKIDAVLPDTLRQDVAYLSTNISFFAANPLDEKQRENVRQLRSAIAERRTVHFHYTKKRATSSETSMREVDPYSLARLANDWLLMGYCHLRQDLRVFRLGRIDHLKLLERQFQRPADFKPDWITASEQSFFGGCSRNYSRRLAVDAARARRTGYSSVVAELGETGAGAQLGIAACADAARNSTHGRKILT